MAAEALLSIALGMINDILKRQCWLFACATNELKRVQGTLQSIEALLVDAERRTVENESVRLWLSSLRNAAYDIEDVVGDWLLEKEGNKDVGGNDGDRRNKLSACLSILHYLFTHHVVSRYKLGVDVNEITERLDDIDKKKNQFNFIQMSNSDGDTRSSLRRSQITTSYMNEEMIGRDDDIETVKSKLISESSNNDKEAQQVRIIAIVGMAGQGKTTLARKIYNHPEVQKHFQGNLYWVFVSDNFDLERLTKEIIQEVKKKPTSLSGLNSLQNELVKALRGKRFLLILDDVWNANERCWKTLQSCLSRGASGSRILVTTRPEKVAQNTMKATFIHRLEGLSLDNSWSLFRTIALEGRSEAECSELESAGKEIAKKCNGVPLCITVMASVMSSKSNKKDWENILDSKMWSLVEGKNEILPAFWLSYDNLPSHLKQCFVYCSIFPKNWELEKEMLVKLWVAQGFIRPDGNRDMEDIGEGYFDDLVAWSIFQKVDVDTYKIHDLLHDLAEFISKDEIYTNDKEGRKLEKGPNDSVVRHAFLSFNSNDGNPNLPSYKVGKLRTLFFDGDVKENDITDILNQAKLLRAMILMSSTIERQPKDIGKLKHLRYMDLSWTPIVELPESVSYLPNLHTLDLNFCGKLKQLPRGIGRMVSLRYLGIKGTTSLQRLPKGLGNISGLKGLSKFIVGGGGGCEIEELQRLNSLQGSLKIEHVERVSSREEAEKAELWNKSHLHSLVLRMPEEGDDDDSESESEESEDNVLESCLGGDEIDVENRSEEGDEIDVESMSEGDNDHAESRRIYYVLEGLRPQKNLENLHIKGYSGWNFPSWMEGMSCLRSLMLSNCKELKSLPDGLMLLQSLEEFTIDECNKLKSLPEGLGRLKKLKALRIKYLEMLTCLPDALGELESLENLTIKGCWKLKSLPDSLGQLEKLQSLSISNCKKFTHLPKSSGQLQMLQSLVIWNCPALLALPNSLIQLKELKSLGISYSEKYTCEPDFLGQLQMLESLTIGKISRLPDSVVQLKALKSLFISDCEILTHLLNSLGELKMLQDLVIQNCFALQSLPDSLVQLKALKSLEISNCIKLTYLPNFLGQLEMLEELIISNCSALLSLPDSLVQLKALEVLEISNCENLTCLPSSLGQLQMLEHLIIENCFALLSLPDSLVQLKTLKYLDI